MSNKLEEVSKMLMNEEMSEIAESSAILDTVATKYEEITLDFFETYFLPYIIYEVEHNDESNMIFNYNYFKIAKQYNIPIVVIGNNGEVLYKLPPLMSDINLSKMDNVAFSKIVSMFTNISDNNSNAANKMLGKALEEVGTLVEVASNDYENSLVTIFQDYKHRLKDSFINDNIKEHFEVDVKKIEEIEEDDDFIDYS